jgi:hypothetical protein
MPHQISYLIEKRVIYHHFNGHITIDEIREGSAAAAELIRGGEPLVHDIVDASGVTDLDFHLRQLFSVANFTKEPQLGWMILVGGNPLVRFFATMLGQVGRVNFHTANNLDEAFAILQRVDPSLADWSPMRATLYPDLKRAV